MRKWRPANSTNPSPRSGRPTPERIAGRERDGVHALVNERHGPVVRELPTASTPVVGSTASRISGRPCGTSAAWSRRREARACSPTRTRCPARASSRRRSSISRRTCSGARDDTDAIIFWGEDKVRRHLSSREASTTRSRASRRRSRPRAWARATASPASCPTCPRAVIAMLASRQPRRHVDLLLPRLRCRRAWSTASARSSPRCSSLLRRLPLQRQGRSTAAAAHRARSWPQLPTVKRTVVVVPYHQRSARRRRRPARREPRGLRSRPRRGRHSSSHRLPVRPSGLHPLLQRHDGRSPSASCTAPAACC